MNKSSADYNILFGIKAAEQGNIAVEHLRDGFSEWVTNKTESLASILQRKGVLDEKACLNIASMVEHELTKNRSLSETKSVLLDESITASLEQFANDPDFRSFLASSRHGIANQGRVESPDRTDPSQMRFRIVRPHAKGGLGEVFVAIDEELDREVALKQIRAHSADNNELRTRFLREAEITGKLEHPGIVPVYGMGRDENGRPYYAMRFIRGKSLKLAISEFHQSDLVELNLQNKELRKLLGSFNDVCQTIAYAHDRGVIHRDLKPDNIMLGRFGETLVVDWGLARMFDSRDDRSPTSDEKPLTTKRDADSAATMVGTAMGTPAYMSPEQAQGRQGELGPRSDIYSLGATLYCLLVGQSAGKGGDVGEVLKHAILGDFEKPRAINNSVPKPLEAICLKAMALDQQDRYETPLEIAADVDAWLADSPVTAWQDSWTVRAGRWIKNNKTAVVGAAAAVVVALISSLVASAFLSSKNQELISANTVAEQKSKIANEQSELSLTTMSQVIRDFQSVFASRNAPELASKASVEARKSMLQNAVSGMLKISSHLKGREDYSNALIIAHTDLSDLYLAFGEEDYSDGRDKAKSELESAFRVCERWLAAEPENFDAQRRYAEVGSRIGKLAWFSDDLEEAVQWHEKSIAISERIIDEREGSQREIGLEHLWNYYFNLATIEFRQFNLDKSVAWYEECLKIYELCEKENADVLDEYDTTQKLPEIKRRIEIFSNLPLIRKDVEHAFTLSDGLTPRALYDCAAWQAADGEFRAAYKTLERMNTIELTGPEYYSNTCGFARCAKALLNDRSIESLTEEERNEFELYASRAVDALKKSKEGGFFSKELDLGLLGRDPDLDVLRNQDDFKKVVERIRASISR